MRIIMRGFLILIVLVVLVSCKNPGAKVLRLAVAANAQYVVEELGELYFKKKKIKVESVVSSSGKLFAQIKNNAPFHIFISANLKYPNSLQKAGLTLNKTVVYAKGGLVLWTVKDINFERPVKDILLSKDAKKIAVPDPQYAPYGVAAVSAFKKYNIYDQIKAKIIFAESISKTNHYILSKAVDMGITSKSTVLSKKVIGKGVWKELDPSYYTPISQGAVILKYALSNLKDEAIDFFNFLLSDEAKKVFAKYGYM
jgi:molybdate transport system substrate-binding protein